MVYNLSHIKTCSYNYILITIYIFVCRFDWQLDGQLDAHLSTRNWIRRVLMAACLWDAFGESYEAVSLRALKFSGIIAGLNILAHLSGHQLKSTLNLVEPQWAKYYNAA